MSELIDCYLVQIPKDKKDDLTLFGNDLGNLIDLFLVIFLLDERSFKLKSLIIMLR